MARKPRKSADDLGAFTSEEHIQQGLEVLKGQGKPTCATCWHFDEISAAHGLCFGIPPTVLIKLDGSAITAFPEVKSSWRCPNWKKAND